MVGICAYGAYLPILRLSRDEIAKTWEGYSLRGEKTVANYDEDSVTMAVEAGADCLRVENREDIEGLYFATTTPPYREKQSAALIATAIDLQKRIATTDFTDSIRSATIALKTALDTVRSGAAKKILITAADTRLGVPQSEFEAGFGDGAAALVVGDEGVIATLEASFQLSDEFIDYWRLEGDKFIESWEDRFIKLYGHQRNTSEALKGFFQERGIKAGDISKAVIYAPDLRSHQAVAKAAGLDYKNQVQDLLFGEVGITGAAHSLLMLAAALEQAKPGDAILLAGYGDGADVFLLKVTDEIEKKRNVRGVSGWAGRKFPINYSQYIKFRGLIPTEGARRPVIPSSAPWLWRGQKQNLALYGSKCRKCRTEQFPIQRVCYVCLAKDDYDLIRLSDRNGKVFTYTKDNLFGSIDPPQVMAVVEMDGGSRLYLQMTDRDPDEVNLHLPIEMTFRRMNENSGFVNYFWKCRPVRESRS